MDLLTYKYFDNRTGEMIPISKSEYTDILSKYTPENEEFLPLEVTTRTAYSYEWVVMYKKIKYTLCNITYKNQITHQEWLSENDMLSYIRNNNKTDYIRTEVTKEIDEPYNVYVGTVKHIIDIFNVEEEVFDPTNDDIFY